MTQKFNEGDRVLVEVDKNMVEQFEIAKKQKGTVLLYEKYGAYLIEIDELNRRSFYFLESEVTFLEEEGKFENSFEYEETINHYLDQYNLTGDKENFEKIKEMTVEKWTV